MNDISQAQYTQISCRNSAAMIRYVTEHKSVSSLPALFLKILNPETLISENYQYLGQPLDLAYFEDENNWYSNEINLQIFQNLEEMGIDAFATGLFVIKNAVSSSNIASLAYLRMLGPIKTFRRINELNKIYNRTKTVEMTSFSKSSVTFKLKYNCAHSHQVTRQNVGVYHGSLELLGMKNIQVEVISDDFNQLRETVIQCTWRSKGALFNFRMMFGRAIARRFCSTYLSSGKVITDYHQSVELSLKQEIKAKEQQRKITEEYYHRLLEEKEQKEEDLNTLVSQRTRELEKSISDKDLLFESFSHELKTPLTLIIGPLERILKEDISSEMRQRLNGIVGNANRLYELVKRLLDFAESKVNADEKEYVVIADKTEFIVSSLQPLAEELQSKIVLKLSSDTVKGIELRPQTWDLLLSNLITNALNHGDTQSNILLNLYSDEYGVCLTVTNRRRAILTENQHKLYQDTLNERSPYNMSGHGIGLSIVKELCRVHGGSFELNQSDCETVARVTLPLTTNFEQHNPSLKAVDTHIEYDSLMHLKSVNNDEKKDTLLLVEDNKELAEFLVAEFALHFNVVQCFNGKEALCAIEDKRVDVIVSDVMMPVMNGFELCKSVKFSDENKHIPFILLSAKSDVASQKLGFSVNADDYVCKPFNSDILIHKIKNMIETYRANAKNLQSYIVEINHTPSIDDLTLSSRDRQFIEKVKMSLEKLYALPQVKAKDFALEFCMSERNLNRKLNSISGKSTMELLRSYRLNKACQRLANGEAVKTVCYDTGFNSPSYFIKCFKEEYGQTPSQFTQSLVNNEQPIESSLI